MYIMIINIGTSRCKRRSWGERGDRKYGAPRKKCKFQLETEIRITKEETDNFCRVYPEIMERRENPEAMVDQEEEDHQAKK